MQIRQVKASRRLCFAFGAKHRSTFSIGGHHKFMKGQSVNAMWRDPPLVESQIFGSSLAIYFRVIILNGLQMFFQEGNSFISRHKFSFLNMRRWLSRTSAFLARIETKRY